MGVKILHLADLHLGYVPSYSDQERGIQRSEEFKSAFRRAVDYALEQGNAIRAVIIAGDLFETYQPDPGLRGFVVAQLGRLCASSIPVLAVPGTHDSIGYPDSVYRTQTFPSCVRVLARQFRQPPLELGLDGEKFTFYWFTYEPGENQSVSEYLAGLKLGLPPGGSSEGGYRVFIAHASLMGSPAWEMRRKDVPVALEELLASGMHYVALGHYHNFWESEGGPTKVVYPGTLEGKHFGENGPRYLVVAEFSSGRVRIHKKAFNRRVIEERTLSLDSEAISSEEELVRRIGSFGRDELLLRLTVTGSTEFAVRPEFLKGMLVEKFFHIEVEDDSTVLSSISAEAIAQEKTIRGMFVKKLRQAALSAPEKERAVYELALKEGLSVFGERK
jgi:exonuclease SbcD